METSERLNFARCFREHAGELGAGADPELGVDVGQVARHRALAEEERGGDLAVRPPLGDKRGDALLGRCQPLVACATADASELRARLCDPRRRAQLPEPSERLDNRVASRTLLPRATSEHPERE